MLFEVIVGKLSKLDGIDSRIKSVEQELKTMKASVEFVHEEVQDLKNENGKLKEMDIETTQRNFLIKLFILKLSISHVHNFFKHINIK
jgi:regulator of replication initiation timing